ncbi:hypothetical protein ACJJTC_017212 [Scirpophaga incertulas]
MCHYDVMASTTTPGDRMCLIVILCIATGTCGECYKFEFRTDLDLTSPVEYGKRPYPPPLQKVTWKYMTVGSEITTNVHCESPYSPPSPPNPLASPSIVTYCKESLTNLLSKNERSVEN